MTEGDLTVALRQLRDAVQTGNAATGHAVDRVLALDVKVETLTREFRSHVKQEARALESVAEKANRNEQRLNQLQGDLEDVEETTGQLELRKQDSERARLTELKGQRDAIVRWGAGIVAGLVLAACSTVAGYAARAFVQDASKPAQAQGQR